MNIGEEAKPPFAILPDLTKVFLARSQRFAELAGGHQLASYLMFLSRLTAAQHEIIPELPPSEPLDTAKVAQALAHGMAPLVIDTSRPDPVLDATLERFVAALSANAVPEATRAAIEDIKTASPEVRLAMAADALEAGPADDIARCTLVLAGLQVHAARLAQSLDADALKPIADGICPSCGKPPAASAVVGWPSANNSRFCFCSLCNTAWNVVRVKCVLCSSTGGITYRTIEGHDDSVKAETCERCKRYVKVVYQVNHPKVESYADDVATLGLDILLREDGWQRGGQNLFLLGY